MQTKSPGLNGPWADLPLWVAPALSLCLARGFTYEGQIRRASFAISLERTADSASY